METELVSDRSCGHCRVCCTDLRIEQPELQKAAGDTCRHCTPEAGCTIYAERPAVCRTWFCGWRRFAWIDAALRPDKAGILVDFVRGQNPPGFADDRGIGFTILTPAALSAAGLAESIARSITADHATFLVVPDRDRQSNLCLFLNDRLGPAVCHGDDAALLNDISALYASAPR
jgi:hypothetical protein